MSDMTTEALLGMTLADHEPLKLLDQLAVGLPATTLTQFKRATRLADADVAAMLQVGSRTLSRLKGAKARLSADLSDRLYAVASIYALAEDVFGDAARVRAWLAESQHGYGGKRPQELLASELGRSQVRELLKRIEHGFLA
jgi:putative toxin-antitoxin system antitoxin component (TIGR02293 family)